MIKLLSWRRLLFFKKCQQIVNMPLKDILLNFLVAAVPFIDKKDVRQKGQMAYTLTQAC